MGDACGARWSDIHFDSPWQLGRCSRSRLCDVVVLKGGVLRDNRFCSVISLQMRKHNKIVDGRRSGNSFSLFPLEENFCPGQLKSFIGNVSAAQSERKVKINLPVDTSRKVFFPARHNFLVSNLSLSLTRPLTHSAGAHENKHPPKSFLCCCRVLVSLWLQYANTCRHLFNVLWIPSPSATSSTGWKALRARWAAHFSIIKAFSLSGCAFVRSALVSCSHHARMIQPKFPFLQCMRTSRGEEIRAIERSQNRFPLCRVPGGDQKRNERGRIPRLTS